MSESNTETPATGAHAAAMAYMDAQRRDMDATEAARQARRDARALAEMVTPDVEKVPDNQHASMGMFTRPQTQSLNNASQRDSVTHTENTFKRDGLVSPANDASADRDRDYARDNDNAGVAYTHMDLQNHDVSVFENILCRLRTNTYNFVGQAGFHNAFSDTNAPHGAPGNSVTLQNGDFRDQVSGGQDGLAHPVGHKPAQHTEYSSAPLSATPPNGSHSTRGSVTSNAVKSESKLDVMKRTMQRMS